MHLKKWSQKVLEFDYNQVINVSNGEVIRATNWNGKVPVRYQDEFGLFNYIECPACGAVVVEEEISFCEQCSLEWVCRINKV
jgi:hypothetical protein